MGRCWLYHALMFWRCCILLFSVCWYCSGKKSFRVSLVWAARWMTLLYTMKFICEQHFIHNHHFWSNLGQWALYLLGGNVRQSVQMGQQSTQGRKLEIGVEHERHPPNETLRSQSNKCVCSVRLFTTHPCIRRTVTYMQNFSSLKLHPFSELEKPVVLLHATYHDHRVAGICTNSYNTSYSCSSQKTRMHANSEIG